MKNATLFIALLALSFSCATETEKPGFAVYNLNHFELNGKVQNLHQKLYELKKEGDIYVKGNEDSHELGDHKVLEFNEAGYITKETKLSINDSRLSYSISFIRNEKNIITATEKKAVEGAEEGAMPTEKVDFQYKDDGKTVYTKNEDLNGNYGSLLYIWDKGRIKEKTQLRGEDYVLNKHNFKYDDKQLLMEYTKEDHDGFGSKMIYARDDQGNIIKETTYLIGGGETDEVYSFKYEYKFDQNGNWIEKTIIENGVPVGVYTRKINYYK